MDLVVKEMGVDMLHIGHQAPPRPALKRMGPREIDFLESLTKSDGFIWKRGAKMGVAGKTSRQMDS